MNPNKIQILQSSNFQFLRLYFLQCSFQMLKMLALVIILETEVAHFSTLAKRIMITTIKVFLSWYNRSMLLWAVPAEWLIHHSLILLHCFVTWFSVCLFSFSYFQLEQTILCYIIYSLGCYGSPMQTHCKTLIP